MKRSSSTPTVAAHYNDIASRREPTRSTHLIPRNFCSWVKAMLIQEACRTTNAGYALDLGGGHGGDLLKWNRAGIKWLVHVDVARTSLETAVNRYKSITRLATFRPVFFCGDYTQAALFSTTHGQVILSAGEFDVVSCQFSLHYAFSSETTAKAAIHNAACNLRAGGQFIVTVPDADKISVYRRGTLATGRNRFRNGVFEIVFDRTKDWLEGAEYGLSYSFIFPGTVEGLEEFIVWPRTLTRLCAEQGLVLQAECGFYEFYTAHLSDKESMSAMACMGLPEGLVHLSAEEKEHIGLYRAFVFVKAPTADPVNASIEKKFQALVPISSFIVS